MAGNSSKAVAFGGVFAALAVALMWLGGVIPAAAFACPALCMLIQDLVLRRCGRRISWAWFGAVAILSMLFSPGKESAAVFLFLGYYPMIRVYFQKSMLVFLWKLLFFNLVSGLMYTVLIFVMGMDQIAAEYEALGTAMLLLLILLGNVTFFLLDAIIEKFTKRSRRR